MTIGERIKQRRLELGLSQEELAKRVGYKSRSSINKLELSRELPSSKISQMAKALDTTEAYLMGWEYDYVFEGKDNELHTIETAYKRLTPGNKKLVEGLITSLLSMQQ